MPACTPAGLKVTTYLDSSAMFLTKRDVFGGLRYLAIFSAARCYCREAVNSCIAAICTAAETGYVVSQSALSALRMPRSKARRSLSSLSDRDVKLTVYIVDHILATLSIIGSVKLPLHVNVKRFNCITSN